MNGTESITQSTGDKGLNIVGSDNVVNYYEQPIKYELLSKLCKGFINSNLNNTVDMNVVELPIELLEKIEYNKLTLHKEMYEELGMYLSDIEEVVDKSLGDNSIKLIRVVKHLYLETISNNPNYSNDQILFAMEDELIKHTDLIDSGKFYNEDIKYSICQIVLYVFEKCQILKKPKK